MTGKFPGLAGYSGRSVVVGIRPEDFEDAAIAKVPEGRRINGQVKLVESLGSELMVHFSIDAKTVNSGDPDAPEQELGEGVANAIARFNPRSTVQARRTGRGLGRPPRTSTSSTPETHERIR